MPFIPTTYVFNCYPRSYTGDTDATATATATDPDTTKMIADLQCVDTSQ